jgi:tetratricopeptide (TPR) repeat protein
MSVINAAPVSRNSQSIIIDYINKEFGHIIVASDDRIFINVFRRTIITELGLPSNGLTVITSPEQLIKCVKEMSVRKKTLILFAQTMINNVRIDDIIKQISWKVRNCKVVIVTTEAEVHHLALLREQHIADSWISKPVIINQLLNKVASIIKPHGNLEKLIAGAEEYLKQGSYRHVLVICKKIFETYPDSAVAYMLMGDAYKGLEQEEEMVEAYEHASYVDELFFEPISKLVTYFHERGDKDKVVHYLEKLDAISPLNMERKMEIARLHLQLGHSDDAHGTFETVMKMTTKKVSDTISETAIKIGAICAENNDPEAEIYFRKAIDVHGSNLDKSHIHLFNNLGIFLRKKGRWTDAIHEYQRALEIDPENDIIYYNLALAHNDGEDFDNASACMRRALRINPSLHKNDPTISYNAGMMFSKNKEYEEAIKFVDNALSIVPDYEPAKKLSIELHKLTSGAKTNTAQASR